MGPSGLQISNTTVRNLNKDEEVFEYCSFSDIGA
jgi:hypothetical protein